MDHRTKIGLLIFFVFLLYCKKGSKVIADQHPIPDVKQFRSFYEKFHRDSLYQLNHILFPMEGIPEQNDTTVYTNGFKWEKEKWSMHHEFNENDTSFVRSFHLIDSTLIIENIQHRLSPLRMERRFSLDSEWRMIFYMPMRMPIEISIE